MKIAFYLKRFWPIMAVTCVIFYFGYHALSGKNGLLQMTNWQQEVDTLEGEWNATRLERLEWEAKVNKMYDDSLDLDLLDEQARHMLGYSHPDEIVIYKEKDE